MSVRAVTLVPASTASTLAVQPSNSPGRFSLGLFNRRAKEAFKPIDYVTQEMVDYFKSLSQSPAAVLAEPVQTVVPVDIPELKKLIPQATFQGFYTNIDPTDDDNVVIIPFKQTKADRNAHASFKLFTKKIPAIEFPSFPGLPLFLTKDEVKSKSIAEDEYKRIPDVFRIDCILQEPKDGSKYLVRSKAQVFDENLPYYQALPETVFIPYI